ncbi:MAG: hypothetical protein A2289_15460 [Deltaproteobacteria bacterium RIFOXYA12_FULL_58_15]|nr:MAG: hypothetical protein A2289_15460 [Deltaproteobacteria bacterium RIFOXYA12_FULL_58_15]
MTIRDVKEAIREAKTTPTDMDEGVDKILKAAEDDRDKKVSKGEAKEILKFANDRYEQLTRSARQRIESFCHRNAIDWNRVAPSGTVPAAQSLCPETIPMGAIMVAKADVFGPMLDFHLDILSSLPSNMKAYVVSDCAASIMRRFPNEFACGRFVVLDLKTDSNWIRDWGPVFAHDERGKMRVVEFSYGPSQYPVADQAASAIAPLFGLNRYNCPLNLEGGNLLFDDNGVLWTTEQVVRANPTKSKEEIEAELRRAFPAMTAIEWLPTLPQERTGHVDMFARIVRPGEVVVADSKDRAWKEILDTVAARFAARGFNKVVRVMNDHGRNTYTNADTYNGVAFVPVYCDPQDPDAASRRSDKAAIKAYQDLGFDVRPIFMGTMISYGGAIHCLTKEVPLQICLSARAHS